MGYMGWQATVARVEIGPELEFQGLPPPLASSAVVGQATAVRKGLGRAGGEDPVTDWWRRQLPGTADQDQTDSSRIHTHPVLAHSQLC